MALLEYSAVLDVRRFTVDINISELDVEPSVQLATLMGREYHFIKERKRCEDCARHCHRYGDWMRTTIFNTYGQYLQVERRCFVQVLEYCTLQHLQLGREISFSSGSTKEICKYPLSKRLAGMQLILSIRKAY